MVRLLTFVITLKLCFLIRCLDSVWKLGCFCFSSSLVCLWKLSCDLVCVGESVQVLCSYKRIGSVGRIMTPRSPGRTTFESAEDSDEEEIQLADDNRIPFSNTYVRIMISYLLQCWILFKTLLIKLWPVCWLLFRGQVVKHAFVFSIFLVTNLPLYQDSNKGILFNFGHGSGFMGTKLERLLF